LILKKFWRDKELPGTQMEALTPEVFGGGEVFI
jgi:hypothetical protein